MVLVVVAREVAAVPATAMAAAGAMAAPVTEAEAARVKVEAAE